MIKTYKFLDSFLIGTEIPNLKVNQKSLKYSNAIRVFFGYPYSISKFNKYEILMRFFDAHFICNVEGNDYFIGHSFCRKNKVFPSCWSNILFILETEITRFIKQETGIAATFQIALDQNLYFDVLRKVVSRSWDIRIPEAEANFSFIDNFLLGLTDDVLYFTFPENIVYRKSELVNYVSDKSLLYSLDKNGSWIQNKDEKINSNYIYEFWYPGNSFLINRKQVIIKDESIDSIQKTVEKLNSKSLKSKDGGIEYE